MRMSEHMSVRPVTTSSDRNRSHSLHRRNRLLFLDRRCRASPPWAPLPIIRIVLVIAVRTHDRMCQHVQTFWSFCLHTRCLRACACLHACARARGTFMQFALHTLAAILSRSSGADTHKHTHTHTRALVRLSLWLRARARISVSVKARTPEPCRPERVALNVWTNSHFTSFGIVPSAATAAAATGQQLCPSDRAERRAHEWCTLNARWRARARTRLCAMHRPVHRKVFIVDIKLIITIMSSLGIKRMAGREFVCRPVCAQRNAQRSRNAVVCSYERMHIVVLGTFHGCGAVWERGGERQRWLF